MEVMVTLLIIAVIALYFIPSFTPLIQSGRLEGDRSQFAADMAFTRSEALKRRQSVTICPTEDGSGCKANNPGDWSSGWIIFVDANSDGNVDSAAADCEANPTADAECILRHQTPINDSNTLLSHDNLSRITIRADGRAVNIVSSARFSICTDQDVGKQREREFIINAAGNITQQAITCDP
jgi:type IV fimbrial biogenesis protein FimT